MREKGTGDEHQLLDTVLTCRHVGAVPSHTRIAHTHTHACTLTCMHTHSSQPCMHDLAQPSTVCANVPSPSLFFLSLSFFLSVAQCCPSHSIAFVHTVCCAPSLCISLFLSLAFRPLCRSHILVHQVCVCQCVCLCVLVCMCWEAHSVQTPDRGW